MTPRVCGAGEGVLLVRDCVRLLDSPLVCIHVEVFLEKDCSDLVRVRCSALTVSACDCLCVVC
jgi:hypothetical protein